MTEEKSAEMDVEEFNAIDDKDDSWSENPDCPTTSTTLSSSLKRAKVYDYYKQCPDDPTRLMCSACEKRISVRLNSKLDETIDVLTLSEYEKTLR